MLRWKKAVVAATVLWTIGLTYALLSGNWVPTALFTAGLMDWTILTLFTQYVKKKAQWRAANMAGINNAITFLVSTMAVLVIIKNPDGMLYIALNLLICYAGAGLGTLIAMDLFPDRPE